MFGSKALGLKLLRLRGFGGVVFAAWRGIVRTRWFEAEEGVRRSKMRRWESEETAERRVGEWGEKEVEWVQEWVGRVWREVGRWGDHLSSFC